MIEGLKHRRAIADLQRRQERCANGLEAAIARAGNRDERDALISELFFANEQFESEISWRETRYLIRKSRHYMIPVPPTRETESWEHSKGDGRWVLSYPAMMHLRSAIREERRQRWEPVKAWLPLVIGLIGSLIGLVSLFASTAK